MCFNVRIKKKALILHIIIFARRNKQSPRMFRKWIEMEKWTPDLGEKYLNHTLIAKEKIHGTNLQWVVSSSGIRAAKRGGYLEEKETFFNWQLVLKQLRAVFEETFHVCARLFQLEEKDMIVRLYGELYGSHYLGIPSKVGAVQRRIFYSPNLHWRCFSLEIEHQSQFGSLCWGEIQQVAKQSQLPLVPVYAVKTWKELALDPFLIQHPIPVEIEEENLVPIKGNECEGVVFEIVDPTVTEDHFWKLRRGRPSMFKHKNPRFEEMASGRTLEQIKEKKKRTKEKMDCSEEILPYLVYNRVENYMTKFSPEEQQDVKNTGKYIQGVILDAVNEYSRDTSIQLTPKQIKALGKHLGRIVRALIEKYLECVFKNS